MKRLIKERCGLQEYYDGANRGVKDGPEDAATRAAHEREALVRLAVDAFTNAYAAAEEAGLRASRESSSMTPKDSMACAIIGSGVLLVVALSLGARLLRAKWGRLSRS